MVVDTRIFPAAPGTVTFPQFTGHQMGLSSLLSLKFVSLEAQAVQRIQPSPIRNGWLALRPAFLNT